jgi:hypothetical protein
MISAMYENGGNTTHRMLDGHPELYVYPFESQLGTSLVADFLQSYVPFKYRWPVLPISGSHEADYELLFDEEMKTRLRRPGGSKFRDADLQIDEGDRKERFVELVGTRARSTASVIEAYFRSTFEAWKNFNRSGREHLYVGYSPVLVLDTERILSDLPSTHILHIVRNPYSGYADTKKRPFPLSLSRYVWTWNLCQHMALTYAERFPENFHLLRFEDSIEDPKTRLSEVLAKIGVSTDDALSYPSWNGRKLDDIYPWGTVRFPTKSANVATMNELSTAEKDDVKSLSGVMQRLLGYENFHG